MWPQFEEFFLDVPFRPSLQVVGVTACFAQIVIINTCDLITEHRIYELKSQYVDFRAGIIAMSAEREGSQLESMTTRLHDDEDDDNNKAGTL